MRSRNTTLIATGLLLIAAFLLMAVAIVRTATRESSAFDGAAPGPQLLPSSSAPTSTAEVLSGPAVGDWSDEPRYVAGNFVVPHLEGFAAFDAVSGERSWRQDDCPGAHWAETIPGPPGDVLVAKCVGDLVGIDGMIGTIAWRIRAPDGEHRVRTSERFLVVQSSSQVQAYDLVTGAPAGDWIVPGHWEVPGDADAVANGTTVFASSNLGLTAFDVATGTTVWQAALPGSGLAATEEEVFVRTNTHQLVALDARTGDLLWETPVGVVRSGWSEIIDVGFSTVVVTSTRRPQYLTVFDRDTGAKLWELDPGDDIVLYSAADDRVSVINQTRGGIATLHDARTGDELLRFAPPAIDRPSVHGGHVAYLVAAGQGGLDRLVVESTP